jgi:hypothetical protein
MSYASIREFSPSSPGHNSKRIPLTLAMKLTPVSRPLIAPVSRNEVSVFLLVATVRMTPRLLDMCFPFDRQDMVGRAQPHRSRIAAVLAVQK